MSLSQKVVTVFGGTGFIGRQIIRELAHAGALIRVPCRDSQSGYSLRTIGSIGQVVPITCDIRDAASLHHIVHGAYAVINCIGVLFEKGTQNFKALHADFPAQLGQVCTKERVQRVVHLSALGIDQNHSSYAASKREGEQGLRAVFPEASILRPSIVFGPEDNFFNQFATLAKYMPFLPLIGGGRTKFQPVFVGDVADAARTCLMRTDVRGATFELGGPETLSFRELYQRLFEHTGCKRPLVPVPFAIAKLKGAMLQLFPKPLLTIDQVRALETDSLIQPGTKTLRDLGITPTALDAILPMYLNRFRAGGRFAEKKRAAE